MLRPPCRTRLACWTGPHSPGRQSPLPCPQRAGESEAGGERGPMAGAYTVAQLTTIAAPLVVACLCLYAHRLKIGGGFLLFWAVGQRQARTRNLRRRCEVRARLRDRRTRCRGAILSSVARDAAGGGEDADRKGTRLNS